MKRTLLMTGIIALGTAGALAQQQPTSPQPPAAKTQPEKGQMHEAKGPWSAHEFMNTAVYNNSGDRIGDVNDLIIDDSGKLQSVVVGVGGFLGMGEKDVALTPDKIKRMVHSDGKTYLTVNATKQDLEALPKYTKPRT